MPEKPAPKSRIEGPDKNFRIRRAAGKYVPDNGAHVLSIDLSTLFAGYHSQYRSGCEGPSPEHAHHSKDELANGVVVFHPLAGAPKA